MHRSSTESPVSASQQPFETARKVGSLYQVAPDIAGLRHLIVNLYFIGEPGSSDWVLVDAGNPGAAAPIIAAAAERFGADVPPRAILLTHGHFDHVGGLHALAAKWDVPIYAHPLELPYLTGRSSYPPPDPTVGGGSMALMADLFPSHPIDLGDRVRPFPSNGTIAELPDWRWFHTPGHSPGHVSFFREKDRAMIVGDAFVTTRQESFIAVLLQSPELNGPPSYFTPDWDSAKASVHHLASMNPAIVATGHGKPMRGERIRQELHTLARAFDEIARPRSGRYVNSPAITNLSGVVRVPPRPLLPTLLGWGALAVAAVLLMRARRFSDD